MVRFREVLELLTSREMIKVESEAVVGINLTGNYFTFYWSLVWPVVESYWITCLYMFKLLKTTTVLTSAKFLTEVQWFGQSLFNERIIGHLESISSDTIKNAMNTFTTMGLIVLGKT